MKFEQFDIWIADLEPRFGTESGKIRPVVIVQSDLLNNKHPSLIVCPITTNIAENVSILRVNLPKGEANLINNSSIMVDQIRAVDKKRLIRKVGSLSKIYKTKIKNNIMIVLDFNF